MGTLRIAQHAPRTFIYSIKVFVLLIVQLGFSKTITRAHAMYAFRIVRDAQAHFKLIAQCASLRITWT